MGEGAIIVALGNRVSARLSQHTYSLAGSIRAKSIQGVTNIVPAYASVLVTYNPLSGAREELTEALASLAFGDTGEHIEGKQHTIPVNFGPDAAPDLKRVADEHGLSTKQAIEIFTSRDHLVYFLGFLPGFAYMGRVGRRLATPRLSTPRVRVPVGSVGIAGVQTGIYPFASPGGWNLVGRTGISVWDPYRANPALFTPGDIVRFVETEDAVEPSTRPASRYEARNPVFRVIESGLVTTIQDLGRPGMGHLGVSPGGASDRNAMLRANAIVGNRPGAAVLEATLVGPALEAMIPTTIALEGTDLGCRWMATCAAGGRLVCTGRSTSKVRPNVAIRRGSTSIYVRRRRI